MLLHSPRVVLLALLGVVLAGALFHSLGFFGASINVVYSDVLGFYERAAAPGFVYISKPIEYPVLTGLFIEGAARIGGSRAGYYATNAFVLLGFAVAATYLLYRMTPEQERGRLWRYWIFAPSMFFFATYNWDLMAVFFSVAAFYVIAPHYGESPRTDADQTQTLRKQRLGLAAFFLALGFAAKFYPVLYFIPLLLAAVTWKERVKLVAIFGATALAVNLPFMFANFDGWSYFFTLNSVRNSNPDSIWTILRFFFSDAAVGVPAINAISLVLFAGAYTWVMVRFRKAPMLWLCFTATLLFLITNKIFSPQYVLWLLPFFVLLPSVKNWQFYGLELANIAVFFSILPWFFFGHNMFYFYLASPFVILRHVALVGIAATLYGNLKRVSNLMNGGLR